MPKVTVVVYGIPTAYDNTHSKTKLKSILETLKARINFTLNMSEDEISIFFPPDLLQVGLGEEIILMFCFSEVREGQMSFSETETVLTECANAMRKYFGTAKIECVSGSFAFGRTLPKIKVESSGSPDCVVCGSLTKWIDLKHIYYQCPNCRESGTTCLN
jgi:hypothetical protein